METFRGYPEDKNKSYKELYKEYRNKFWKKHHQYKELESKVYELEAKLALYENKEYFGQITMISDKNDYGFITYSKNPNPIFFHISHCNFQLNGNYLERKVKFKINMGSKMEAIDVSLLMNPNKNIQSGAFEVLDSYIS